jgi:transposase
MKSTPRTAAELERRRHLAVTRLAEGRSQVEVAAFLGVHPRTVCAWWKRHRADPDHGLDARPHPGQKPKLTPEQEAVVLSWFGQSPTAFGFPNELWTAGRVASLIERTFAVHFHPRYVSAWLARRRITPQKPEKQARERDPAKVERWRANDWAGVKKVEAGATLILVDEAGALLAPLVRRTLARRGCTPILKHRARHREKVSMIAALTLNEATAGPGLYFRTYPKEYVNNVKAADFLREVLGRVAGEVVVVWDGGPMHKGDPIRALLGECARLSIVRLPPYCPHFNPVEYLWSWLKYGQLPNYAAPDAQVLDQAVCERLRSAQGNGRLLQGFWDHCELPITRCG